MSKYILTLENGDVREVEILPTPVFKVYFHGDASAKYRTRKDIVAEGNRIKSVDYTEAYTLFGHGGGHCFDEGTLFANYKALRNPIVKLERE